MAPPELRGFSVQFRTHLKALDLSDFQVVDGFFVHFVAPQHLPAMPKHIVFVIDTSGSMMGKKMKQTKNALRTIIGELREKDHMTLLSFSDEVSTWDGRGNVIASVNKDNVEAALNHIDALEARGKSKRFIYSLFNLSSSLFTSKVEKARNIRSKEKYIGTTQRLLRLFLSISFSFCTILKRDRLCPFSSFFTGGTNLNDALVQALTIIAHVKHRGVLKTDVQPMIFFLTDGHATAGETDNRKIMDNINRVNIETAIFTLAFGRSADFDLLKALSLMNNGFARKIYVAADASLQLEGFYKEVFIRVLLPFTELVTRNV